MGPRKIMDENNGVVDRNENRWQNGNAFNKRSVSHKRIFDISLKKENNSLIL